MDNGSHCSFTLNFVCIQMIGLEKVAGCNLLEAAIPGHRLLERLITLSDA